MVFGISFSAEGTAGSNFNSDASLNSKRLPTVKLNLPPLEVSSPTNGISIQPEQADYLAKALLRRLLHAYNSHDDAGQGTRGKHTDQLGPVELFISHICPNCLPGIIPDYINQNKEYAFIRGDVEQMLPPYSISSEAKRAVELWVEDAIPEGALESLKPVYCSGKNGDGIGSENDNLNLLKTILGDEKFAPKGQPESLEFSSKIFECLKIINMCYDLDRLYTDEVKALVRLICSDKDVNEKSNACTKYLKKVLPQKIEAEFNSNS